MNFHLPSSEIKLRQHSCIYCAPDFVLDAQKYPIFLVDIFMTFILQAGVSKRHQKVPNWAIEVLKSSLRGKMKLFPAASPAAAIAANRGITVVCLLHLCSFYRECELFFLFTYFDSTSFFPRAIFLNFSWKQMVMGFKVKSPQTGNNCGVPASPLFLLSRMWVIFLHTSVLKVFLRAWNYSSSNEEIFVMLTNLCARVW